MEIAIIIPAYNEELTISRVIKEFYSELPEASIYVIDNNSKDKTKELALKTYNETHCKGKLLSEYKQGKAFAMRRAFMEIEADIYVMVDADCTYPANEIKKIIEPIIQAEADMVVGDRITGGHYFQENKRRFHSFGNRLVKKIINSLFKANIKDVMSGYRAFSKRFVKNLPILTSGFELETEITLHALDNNFRIVEIPIEYKDRIEGSFSKLNTFSDGFKVIKRIISIFRDFKPYAFFTLLAILNFIAGIAVGLPVIIEFIKTRYITKTPSAILATGFMIFGVILYAISLILNTIVRHFKADYEIKLLNFNQHDKNK